MSNPKERLTQYQQDQLATLLGVKMAIAGRAYDPARDVVTWNLQGNKVFVTVNGQLVIEIDQLALTERPDFPESN